MTQVQTQTAEAAASDKPPQIEIPKTLRWRPMPAPFDINKVSMPIVTETPDGPEPCRRCLQDSKPGEQLLLVSYDPFLGDSPYRCSSPIFLHHPPCQAAIGFNSAGGILPEQQRKRRLAVRAYTKDHMMRAHEVVDGIHVIETCERMFNETDAEYAHLYNVSAGCFAVRVDKVVSQN